MGNEIFVRIDSGPNSMTQKLFQWDKGRVLRVHGIPDGSQITVEYSNAHMSESIRPACSLNDGEALSTIPDTLLMLPYNIQCYIVVVDSASTITRMCLTIPVIARQKPADYEYTPEQIDGYTELLGKLSVEAEKVSDLKKQIDEATRNASSAASSATSAAKQAESVTNKLNGITFEVNLSDGCLYMNTP